MKKTEKRIKKLFDNKLLPLAHRVEDTGLSYFNMHVNKEADSYYRPMLNSKRMYYSFIDTSDVNALKDELKKLWEDLDNTELLPLIDELSLIASELEKFNKTQSEDLSEFVYIMY